jgi:hypothetical protein
MIVRRLFDNRLARFYESTTTQASHVFQSSCQWIEKDGWHCGCRGMARSSYSPEIHSEGGWCASCVEALYASKKL